MPKSPAPTAPAQQSFSMSLTDEAQVTLDLRAFDLAHPGLTPVPFIDQGFMPITQLTLGDDALKLPGGFDGMFLHYHATGTQDFQSFKTAEGAPIPKSAQYETLTYDIVGYKGGTPQFSPSTDTVGGIRKQVVLAHGTLITDATHVDRLSFSPNGIDGTVFTSVSVGGKPAGELDFAVHHNPAEIGTPTPYTVTLTGGSVQATYVPLPA